MPQPVTLACALLLLTITAAQAQATRVRRRTVAASPTEPLPELRVAAGVKTPLLPDAKVDKNSVQLEATHVRVVEVGELSLTFETLITPTAECRAESIAAMQLLEVEFDNSNALEVEFDVNQPRDDGKDRCADALCLPLGPITSRVKVGSGKLVRGTLLSGQVWRDPVSVAEGVYFATVRWTEATLPDGSQHPVCIESWNGGEKRCPNGGFESCRQMYSKLVKRWDRKIIP